MTIFTQDLRPKKKMTGMGPLTASNPPERNFFSIFFNFYFIFGLHKSSGPQKGILFGGFIMEARILHEIKPYMMYVFQPLRTCTMYLSTHHGHLRTLVASNDLHFQKKLIFSCIKCIFFSTFTSVWHKICLKDLKKVYYQGGSLQ